jgi:multicomponent Na+:H+ antiporter subunit E
VSDQSSGAVEILVPVGESVTLRNTVAYAVRTAQEDADATLHFVAPVVPRGEAGTAEAHEAAADLLDRAEVWAREDAGEDPLDIETAFVGTDEYLFSPDDFARVIGTYAAENGVDRVIVDPEYSPGGNVTLLQPMEDALRARGFDVEEAPVERRVRRGGQFLRRGGLLQFATLFGASFLFYQLLSGFDIVVAGDSFTFVYELATGIVAATVVATALNRVTFAARPDLTELLGILGRMVLYVPYLLYEIVVANIQVSYVILHPKLPIDPKLTRVRAAVWGSTAITTLANSITLTPGTVTVDVRERNFYVHALTQQSRDDLYEGALERAVRFVFFGRDGARVPSPRERGQSQDHGTESVDDDVDDGDTAETRDSGGDTS